VAETVSFRLGKIIADKFEDVSSWYRRDKTSIVKEAIEAKHQQALERLGPNGDPSSLLALVFAAKRSEGEGRRAFLMEIREKLSRAEAGLLFTGPSGRDALAESVRDRSDFELTRMLIEASVEVDCPDQYGRTPLMLAVQDQPDTEDVNLAVIDFLLDRGAWIFRANQPHNTQDIYEEAERKGLRGTMRLLRIHAQQIPLARFQEMELRLGRELNVLERLQRIARFRFIQGRTWLEIYTEIKRLIEEQDVWLEISRMLPGDLIQQTPAWIFGQMGVWRRLARERIADGITDAQVIQELRSLGCNWPDVALALSRADRTPIEVLGAIFPFLEAEDYLKACGIGSLAMVIHAAYYHFPGALDEIPEFLRKNGIDVLAVLEAGWFRPEWRAEIRTRMGLPPKSDGITSGPSQPPEGH